MSFRDTLIHLLNKWIAFLPTPFNTIFATTNDPQAKRSSLCFNVLKCKIWNYQKHSYKHHWLNYP